MIVLFCFVHIPLCIMPVPFFLWPRSLNIGTLLLDVESSSSEFELRVRVRQLQYVKVSVFSKWYDLSAAVSDLLYIPRIGDCHNLRRVISYYCPCIVGGVR